ncbi:hypothetical protein J8F10_24280 [Gemmata sp. G18]|uniref:Leucine-rich repeat domain-containing protein n=1 Tax=Gemmata palustris TaxID=2822762 RepID=A0ABS5BXE0_9BACT|nr:hypothetical protein [Gemmata palustris]MBP3958379.1 hypothetical protein [Gemmata palustris]
MSRILVFILSTPFLVGCSSGSAPPETSEREASALVSKLGGRMTQEVELPDKPISVFLVRCQTITEEDLRKLAGVRRLLTLHLMLAAVNDDALKGLTGCENLGLLDLSGTLVTDEGLKVVAGLKNISHLDLSMTKVTDAGLKELIVLKKLTNLNLSETKVTEAGIEELKRSLKECVVER